MLRVLLLCGMVAGGAVQAEDSGSYDLLFRNGTLDAIDRDETLVYRREVTNTLTPETAKRDSGDIRLSFADATSPMAALEFRQGEKYRGLGQFPASVGNPMIMVFYEAIVRDMAESAGGSPFYIRNRVKEALVQPARQTAGEAVFEGRTIPTVTVHMTPFAGDPNSAKMKGFGALEMRVTMSEEVPGWYVSLVAEAAGDGAPVYRSALEFARTEPAQ